MSNRRSLDPPDRPHSASGLPAGGLNDDDMVQMRFGDAKALDARVSDAEDQVRVAKADLQAIVNALELDLATEMTAHQVVVSHVLPAIKTVMVTAKQVAIAEHEMRTKLDVVGDRGEIDLGGGRRAKLVGRRLPKEIADKIRRPR